MIFFSFYPYFLVIFFHPLIFVYNIFCLAALNFTQKLKLKMEGNGEANLETFEWKEFKFERILANNASRKVVFVLGNCFEKKAIVILEKQA